MRTARTLTGWRPPHREGEPSPGWRTPPGMENPPDGEPPPRDGEPPRMEKPPDGEPPRRDGEPPRWRTPPVDRQTPVKT